MPETKSIRLAVAAKEFNVATATIIEHLKKSGHDVENRPTTKLTEEMYGALLKAFHKDKGVREQADQIAIGVSRKREEVALDEKQPLAAPRREEVKEDVHIQSRLADAPVTAAADVPVPKPEEKAPPVAAEASAETSAPAVESEEKPKPSISGPKVVGKVDLDQARKPKPAAPKAEPLASATPEKEAEPAESVASAKPAAEPAPSEKPQEAPAAAADDVIRPEKVTLDGPRVVGKIELPVDRPRESAADQKRKRKRIQRTDTAAPGRPSGPSQGPGQGGPRPGGGGGGGGGGRSGAPAKGAPARRQTKADPAASEKEIREKIRQTMGQLAGSVKGKGSRSKLRRAKRDDHAARADEAASAQDEGLLQVTEFISVAELANLMDVTATQVISTCMSAGVIVSINQRLDAEVIELVAGEFGYQVEFIDASASGDDELYEEEDEPEDLLPRAPIVTIMGHVDHGKTSLLDYIRSANVVAGEKGGITQHIGAYEVTTEAGQRIAFLDTPGHEAFTAMRARGAKVTDIAVIIVAADDAVMPQTREAISHAQAAGVPMIFAINKIDKPGANPDKIKEQLSGMNILVEDWGGKFQVQNVSAKSGEGIPALLEKILLEAELLELKANPGKAAVGSVVEASLDKGRGYVSNVMVQEGTLRVGDMVVAGSYYGKVKAMFNERNKAVEEAGPSTPLLLLGLNGAPQAGERFRVYDDEQLAKEVASRRAQIQREQGIRTQKHLTLDEIGRRLALGSFKELNVIIRGDVDGSVEALTDSLLKLSTEEIQVNVVHKGVGQITESDVLLAAASDAIILGFQVRPSMAARKLAEREQVEIRLYSIIYDAIEQIRSAMEGMLEAKIEEKITSNVEVREVFKISKVGTVAGCFVLEGKLNRQTKVRLIRDGIVVHSGTLASLKRFKDDVKEVVAGMECGMHLANYNDIRIGDIIEGYEEIEIKRKLG
jgi:translation initiation factor IF-2